MIQPTMKIDLGEDDPADAAAAGDHLASGEEHALDREDHQDDDDDLADVLDELVPAVG